jgi:hypothetical protein
VTEPEIDMTVGVYFSRQPGIRAAKSDGEKVRQRVFVCLAMIGRALLKGWDGTVYEVANERPGVVEPVRRRAIVDESDDVA